MRSEFNLTEIYDQNVNILFGAGASFGLFPTLALGVKEVDGTSTTIETLATAFNGKNDNHYTALFMHYYKYCIEPVLTYDFDSAIKEATKKIVLDNYVAFFKTILKILNRKRSGDRKVCNIFTTNYDGCLTYAAEELMRLGSEEFFLNDGTCGFKRRFLDARNFNTVMMQTGVLGRHKNEIPQINVVNLHGSTYWHSEGHRIRVDYQNGNSDRLIKLPSIKRIDDFSRTLMDKGATVADIPKVDLKLKDRIDFWRLYNALPIVNPTKWKFYETVFEEHYYQMLRYLSYELEKPNSTLLIFGFSFADEHIRQLLKRSISNPSLQLFIFCFDEMTKEFIDEHFRQFPNVQTITHTAPLDFTIFNEKFFTTSPKMATTLSIDTKAAA